MDTSFDVWVEEQYAQNPELRETVEMIEREFTGHRGPYRTNWLLVNLLVLDLALLALCAWGLYSIIPGLFS